MRYIRLFENKDKYEIGEYVMYINKERVFGDELIDKPELAQVIDNLEVIDNLDHFYIRIIEDDDELWCNSKNLRKLEPWELDAIKYNL